MVHPDEAEAVVAALRTISSGLAEELLDWLVSPNAQDAEQRSARATQLVKLASDLLTISRALQIVLRRAG